MLGLALQTRSEFTTAEFDGFKVAEFCADSFILVVDKYFEPAKLCNELIQLLHAAGFDKVPFA